MGKPQNRFIVLLSMLGVKQAKIFDFAIEHKVKLYKIHCLRNGKKIILLVLRLIKTWPCIILLTETMPESMKSLYKGYRRKELITISYHKLNRLLQFTRAVGFPALTGRCNVGVGL